MKKKKKDTKSQFPHKTLRHANVESVLNLPNFAYALLKDTEKTFKTMFIKISKRLLSGCPYGKYGENCHLSCPNNCNGLCDLKTGNCLLGCLDGWLGEKCDTGKIFFFCVFATVCID